MIVEVDKLRSQGSIVEAYPLLPTGSDADAEYTDPTEIESDYFLTTDAVRISQQRRSRLPTMRFFDNLRGWDKFKVYRYVVLLALSLSGDGWYVSRRPWLELGVDDFRWGRSYESGVIASIIQLPAWIAHLGYSDGVIPE